MSEASAPMCWTYLTWNGALLIPRFACTFMRRGVALGEPRWLLTFAGRMPVTSLQQGREPVCGTSQSNSDCSCGIAIPHVYGGRRRDQ